MLYRFQLIFHVFFWRDYFYMEVYHAFFSFSFSFTHSCMLYSHASIRNFSWHECTHIHSTVLHTQWLNLHCPHSRIFINYDSPHIHSNTHWTLLIPQYYSTSHFSNRRFCGYHFLTSVSRSIHFSHFSIWFPYLFLLPFLVHQSSNKNRWVLLVCTELKINIHEITISSEIFISSSEMHVFIIIPCSFMQNERFYIMYDDSGYSWWSPLSDCNDDCLCSLHTGTCRRRVHSLHSFVHAPALLFLHLQPWFNQDRST